MVKKQLIISNRLGLHARAAAKFVERACRYSSRIWLMKDQKKVDGKSILNVMTLGAAQGAMIEIIADGEDEEDAATDLETLINLRFFESE